MSKLLTADTITRAQIIALRDECDASRNQIVTANIALIFDGSIAMSARQSCAEILNRRAQMIESIERAAGGQDSR